jgi:hypothetical protein
VVSRSAAHDEDAEIDDLYRGPLEAFTPARNAMVKSLRGADASRVRKLAKPTVVAWAANQLYWHARPTYDRLLKSGERLRKAQIAALEGKSSDVRAASDAHRRAIGEAAQEAERLAQASAAKWNAANSAALMRTFEALSLAPEPPEPPGRLTQALQPAGFEALAGISPVAKRRDDGSPDRDERAAPHKQKESREQPSGAKESRVEAKQRAQAEKQRAIDAKREVEREKEERQRQAEIRKAEAALERARAAESLARETLARAERDRREVEARLRQLQS